MIKLYKYQKETVRKLDHHFLNHTAALLVMATGLGKTLVAAFMARKMIKKGRGLFLCHDSDILKQAMEDFHDAFGDSITTGIFYGERKDMEKVDVLFATFQTFREWKEVFFKDEFYFIFVDEGHHSEADTFRPVIEYFEPKVLLGMTATPDRMDGREIREIFGNEVVCIGLEEAIAKGYLTNVEYHVLTDHLNTHILKQLLKEINAGDRRVSIKQLNETIFIRRRDEEISRIITSYNLKSILFCENIEHAETMAAYFPNSKTFHSKNSTALNDLALQQFRNGEIQYIVTVDKFNEGKDIPNAGLVAFLRCTDSKRIFWQQLGRGLRKALGKNLLVVLDFVANCNRVIMVEQLMERIKKISRRPLDKNTLRIDGKSFSFIFDNELRDVIEIIRAVQNKLYISDIPHLLAEYILEQNPDPPEIVRAGTDKKLWWKCSKPECRHEWRTEGYKRVKGHGCPACSNNIVTSKNCLAVTHPELAKEFHPIKNFPLTPNDVVAGTHKKLWWKCSKPECGHEWQVSGHCRRIGSNCPACVNQVTTPKNCLAITHPDLAKEFHPSKNDQLTPYDVVAGTNKKLWWKCSKPECGYEWLAIGQNRKKDQGCPACSNKSTTPKNCLAITHPDLTKEFHPSKNDQLTPYDVVAGTNKKLWWKCSTCEHEWQAIGNSRLSGRGCPACSNKVATPKNCLATTHPNIATEFHPTKNTPLTTNNVVAGTGKKLWWKCSKPECGHEWRAVGAKRVEGRNCPACSKEKKTEA